MASNREITMEQRRGHGQIRCRTIASNVYQPGGVAMTAPILTRLALTASLLLLLGGCTGTDAVAQDRERTEQEIRAQLGEVPAVVDTVAAMNLSSTFRAAAARALPSVVTIQVTSQPQAGQRLPMPLPFPFQEREPAPQMGTGSGFVFTEAGHIITNNHVVENATSVQVVFVDGRIYDDAEVVGRDPHTDLAVIRIEPRRGERFQPLPIGDSDRLQVGDWVLALGNPLQLGFTVTAGIVSAKGRALGIIQSEIPLESFIQTDAVINRGNSGGPLVDLLGRAVGVNTAIVSPTGAFAGNGFAIPIALAEKAARDLIEHGAVRRPRLGVLVQAVTEAQAELYGLDRIAGAVVIEVQDGTPAARAGIRAEDVIIAVDGEPVNSSTDLTTRLARYQPGDQVTLTVVRDRRSRQMAIRLAEFETAQPTARTAAVRESAQQRLGFAVSDLNPQWTRELGLEEGVQGVVVTSVSPQGPAAQALIRPGDVILEMNRQPVRNAQELERVARAVERGDIVVIRVRSRDTGNIGVRSFRVR
jgi:serine protease Do